MRCALINTTSNLVENIIMADPAVDAAPAGYVIVAIPDGQSVAEGWSYDPATGQFIDPNPAPSAG